MTSTTTNIDQVRNTIGTAGGNAIEPAHQSNPNSSPNSEVRHNDLLKAQAHLMPRPLPDGPRARIPLFREAGDVKRFTSQLDNMLEGVEGRRRNKEAECAEATRSGKVWWALLKSWRTLGHLDREIASAKKLETAIKGVKNALQNLQSAKEDVLELRSMQIPTELEERKEFFRKLEAAVDRVNTCEAEVRYCCGDLHKAADARRNFIKKTRWNNFWRGIYGLGDRFANIDALRSEIQAFNSTTPKAISKVIDDNMPRPLGTHMAHEAHRVAELESRMAQASAIGGDAAVCEILSGNDGQGLKADIALQAIRGGEGLTPDLKDTLPETAIIGKPKVLAEGGYNQVLEADVRIGDRTEKFVLKAVESRIGALQSHTSYGGSKKQIGILNRHAVGHQFAEELGSLSVKEPKYIMYKGRLHLAMPKEDGYAPDDVIRDIRSKHGRVERDRVLSALYKNENLLDAMVETQILNAAMNYPDNHSNNMRMRFYAAGDVNKEHSLSPDEIKDLSTDEIKALQVEVGMFDFDFALAPDGDVDIHNVSREVMVLGDGTMKRSLESVPKRSFYYGLPPYHTAGNYERICKMDENLKDPAYCAKLRWRMTEDELEGVKRRVGDIRDHFEKNERTRINIGETDEKYRSAQPLDETAKSRMDLIKKQGSQLRFAGYDKATELEKYRSWRNFPMFHHFSYKLDYVEQKDRETAAKNGKINA